MSGSKSALVALFALLAGCGDVSNPGDDASPPDTGSPDDAGVDVTVTPDASDGAAQAEAEAEAEAGPTSQPWGRDIGAGYAIALAGAPTNGDIAIGITASGSNWPFANVQRFDSSGNLLSQTTAQPGATLSVAFDFSGNLYASFWAATSGTDFGGGPTGQGAVLVKYDANGAYQWHYGAFPLAAFQKIAVKSNGNIVIAGANFGVEDYGGGNVTTNGYSGSGDVLLIEITPAKAFVRAKTWGGAGDQNTSNLALDSSDDIVIAGGFEGTLDFGGGVMTGPSPGSSAHNLFIAKLDPSTQYLHQLQLQSSTTGNSIQDIALDATGNVFVCGYLGDQVNLGGKNLLSAGSGDVLLGKLDPSLGHVWSKRFGDAQSQTCAAIGVDAQGGIVIAGQYQGGLNFGLGYLPSGMPTYVARFDSSGTALADTYTVTGYISGVRLLATPDFAIAGTCSGSVQLGPFNFPCKAPNQGYESFVARFAPP